MTMKRGRGTVFVHAGKWYYSAKLPGTSERLQRPLKLPGTDETMPGSRPRSQAERAAARMWEAAAHPSGDVPDDGSMTVEDLCARYCEHAAVYYRHLDGSATSECAASRIGIRLFREMYSRRAVGSLSHRDMLAHRDALVASGASRGYVNRCVGHVRRMICWALDEALIPAFVKAELTQVRNLKRGRSAARENPPVGPVDDASVDKVLSALVPNTADMVRVHALTGMRPCELCAMRWSLIDQSSTPWVYRVPPDANKNSWRGDYGIPRAVCIGPKARAILERHRGSDRPFSPAAAVREWLEAKRAARKTPVQPSQVDRSIPGARRVPGDVWHTSEYTRAVKRACARAGVAPWGTNRLRHSFATKVRTMFGLDACRAVLGHSGGSLTRITDRYSFDAIEDEQIRTAAPAVEALG